MKPQKNSPRPGRYRGGNDNFTVTRQQEGHIVHGVPEWGDDASNDAWERGEDADDD